MEKWKRKNGSINSRAEEREKEKDVNYFLELMKVMRHFFPKFNDWLKEVRDARHSSYVYYDANLIILMRLLGGMMGISSMRDITRKFNKEACIKNVRDLLGDYSIDELPRYDTINDFLEELDPKELETLRHKLITRLIQMKCFNAHRFKKRWLVSIDGTGLYVFKKRHCEHCLTKTYNKGRACEYTLYFHYVLEAKLIIGDMVLSIGSEYVENPRNLEDGMFGEDFDEKAKQDCELSAFYRLEKRLKKDYPRLPICLLLDSLYANQNVFEICKKNDWWHIIRFKEGKIPTITREFETISQYEGKANITVEKNDNNFSEYRFVNGIDYEGHKVNVTKFTETTENTIKKVMETRSFTFITSSELSITKKNQKEMVTAGRSRWKIENHGFNEQKNHGYELEHPFSENYTAMKNHYILIQISHIIRQLFEEGIKIIKEFKKTLSNISYDILEHFRTITLSQSDIECLNKCCQIRINCYAVG